ncbi:MAG: cation diffusion facilitator family transporter [Flavobacteriales bacterium]|nr:cation diffusion facilitator family transporter [Flavobacteriales bacterium]
MHDHFHHSGHDHHKDHSDNSDLKNISVAFFLNFAFTLVEIVGGFFTNSVAILADAIHDLGDSLSLGLAWYFQRLSKKGSDHKYSYGYKRFSVLGALINSMVLLLGSAFILIETIPRLWAPEESNAKGMILLAVLGILVNGAAFFRLKKGESLNEKVVSLHLLEDVLGWVAVLIGGIAMLIWDIPILDPILSLLISGYILFNVFRNLKKAVKIIMQGSPSQEALLAVKTYFDTHPKIIGHHDLHLWTMDGIYHILTVHLIISKETYHEDISELKKEIRAELKTQNNIEHPTLEFELEGENCELGAC